MKGGCIINTLCIYHTRFSMWENHDERKSIGVICTYSDQAKQIKNKIKGEKFENFSKKREERLIINTVDDFQGDERDIIILSMVRNPKEDIIENL